MYIDFIWYIIYNFYHLPLTYVKKVIFLTNALNKEIFLSS